MPWYVTTFLKLISPFIDPVTKTKMRYNEPLTDHIPSSQLMKDAGGEVDFEYDHDVYWPALDALAKERREARKERWGKAGKLIGESEIYLWGGDEPSIGAKEAKAEAAEQAKEVKEGEKEEDKKSLVEENEEKKVADITDGVAKVDVKEQKEPVPAAAA